MKNINKNIMKRILVGGLMCLTLLHLVSCGKTTTTESTSANGRTVKAITERGMLLCGVSTGLVGFSSADSAGDWRGIDVDFCKAVAAAVLGDATKVTFVPLTAKERFTALQSGEVDILSRNSTWTITRDTGLGLSFVGTTYYDGAGFLVKKKNNIKKIQDLNGATICTMAGSTTELNIADYAAKHGLTYTSISYETVQKNVDAFVGGRCDAFLSDRSMVSISQTTLPNPEIAEVLDEVISKEPLGPIVRQGDARWFNIVRWTLFAMIAAEEHGITRKNVHEVRKTTTSPEIKRLLGLDGRIGADLGLDDVWVYNIIRQVGNYGESYERNLGKNSPLKLKRGMNNLWNKGGLHYSMPFR